MSSVSLRILCAVLVAASAAAQGVRLTRVPDCVILPAAAGQNLLVEAEVLGKSGDVWLATRQVDTARVPLEPAGENLYQINLGDRRVMRLLPADRDTGHLQVFASRGGRTVQSAKIAWVRSPRVQRVQCVMIGTDGKQQVCDPALEPWLRPSKVERIELRGLDVPHARALGIADGATLPFARRDVQKPFVLAMNDGTRRSIFDAMDFGIEVQHGAKAQWFGFRVVPGRLQPEEPTFHVLQRRRAKLPGSNGWLSVRVGDITGGQTMLTVTDALGQRVTQQRSMGANDYVTIQLAQGAYVLVIDRLVNRLVGDDHAELRIVDKKRFRPSEIAAFIRHVGSQQGVLFVREGVNYSPELAQQFLRARRAAHRGKDLTTEQFVALASKSSRTGEPYHVQLADGRKVVAAKWFTEQLQLLRKKNPAKASAK